MLDTGMAPTAHCLTVVPGSTPWILLDLRLLYHVTGFQLLESSVLSVTVSHGTDRENLTVNQLSVSQQDIRFKAYTDIFLLTSQVRIRRRRWPENKTALLNYLILCVILIRNTFRIIHHKIS